MSADPCPRQYFLSSKGLDLGDYQGHGSKWADSRYIWRQRVWFTLAYSAFPYDVSLHTLNCRILTLSCCDREPGESMLMHLRNINPVHSKPKRFYLACIETHTEMHLHIQGGCKDTTKQHLVIWKTHLSCEQKLKLTPACFYCWLGFHLSYLNFHELYFLMGGGSLQ